MPSCYLVILSARRKLADRKGGRICIKSALQIRCRNASILFDTEAQSRRVLKPLKPFRCCRCPSRCVRPPFTASPTLMVPPWPAPCPSLYCAGATHHPHHLQNHLVSYVFVVHCRRDRTLLIMAAWQERQHIYGDVCIRIQQQMCAL